MTSGNRVEHLIAHELRNGASPSTLVAAGYAKSTVYKVRASLGERDETVNALRRRVEQIEATLRYYRLDRRDYRGERSGRRAEP